MGNDVMLSINMKKALFILSAFVPVVVFISGMGAVLMWYSLFVLLYFLRERIAPVVKRIPLPTFPLLFLMIWVLGMATEATFWSDMFVIGVGDTGLDQGRSPNLWTHLYLYLGLYGSIALAWTLMLWWFRFTLPQVFITQGVAGFTVEQQFAIVIAALANPLTVIWFPYLAAIYSPFVAIPFMLLQERIGARQRLDHWIKYPLALFLQIFILSLLTILASFWS